jgi:nitrite reductase/ring-hydroxylating ferredoxin subunit
MCNLHGAKFDAETGMAKAVAPRALGKVTTSVAGGSVRVRF